MSVNMGLPPPLKFAAMYLPPSWAKFWKKNAWSTHVYVSCTIIGGLSLLDGVLWADPYLFAAKFVPLAYGIKKLQISCVVEDDKVCNIVSSTSRCDQVQWVNHSTSHVGLVVDWVSRQWGKWSKSLDFLYRYVNNCMWREDPKSLKLNCF